MPSDMLNATFAAAAAVAFNDTPAHGPYTLAMSNSAIWVSLPNMTADYSAVLDRIHTMAANVEKSSEGAHLPIDYGSDPTLIEGYQDQLLAIANLLANPRAPSLESGFTTGTTAAAVHLHPLSRGTVRLNLSDPLQPPVLDYRSASNPIDIELHLIHLRYLRRMVDTKTLMALGAFEASPGSGLQSDEQLLTYIRNRTVQSFMHPCCTSAMLPRKKGGVVAPDLRVYGARGLRIVDAGVFPILPSAHLSATAYAVAEKVGRRLEGLPFSPSAPQINTVAAKPLQ
jgi:choline dehydrogenase-like flavoprotein